MELCDRYGDDLIQQFFDQFQDYAERMTGDAISRLPKGRVSGTCYYDCDLPAYPNGIPISASIDIDPSNGYIDIDLTDNVDNVPLGINLTECTTLASCRMSTLNVLGKDIPRCTGSFRRIRVKMRDGAVIGRPRFPAATSAATSNSVARFRPICMLCMQNYRTSTDRPMGPSASRPRRRSSAELTHAGAERLSSIKSSWDIGAALVYPASTVG